VTSPYTRVGPRLIDLGYSAIPIVPGEKRPGAFMRGEWRGMKEWERYCDRLPTTFEVNAWEKWPDAGVCVALGRASNLIAIDFDYGPDDLRRQLEALLPPTPVKKKGAKGYTAFYRGSDITARKWRVGGQSVMEILGHGRQTVLPPTIHPDGMPYAWLTPDTLENTSARELPELPDDLIERVERVIAPWQTDDDKAPTAKRSVVIGENDSYWREINDRAMADFGAWVPELFPMAKARGDGSYRVTAHWRNCENPNVSIHPDGITDWGEGRSFTPLDLVMAAAGGDFDAATNWLKERVGMPNVQPIVLQMKPKSQTQEEPEPETAPRAEPVAPGFFDVGGIMRHLFDAIIASARRPQPILAVGACIAAMGVLMGRKYRTTTNLRSNVYVVSIADSGAGKDVARQVVARAFLEAGLGEYLGGSKIASGAGLISATSRHPAILFQQDEFGQFLAAATDRRRAPRHLTEIVDLLTEMHSAASGIWFGAEYGNQKENPRKEIIQPHLCVHGTSTPGQFWSALQSGNAHDGSIARYLIFATEESYPDPKRIDGEIDLSDDLIDGLRAVAWPLGSTGNLSQFMAGGDVAPKEIMTVPLDADAEARLDAISNEINNKQRQLAGTSYTAILARQWEYTSRLSMIRAVSRDSQKPVITLADVRWAEIVVQRSVDLLIDGIDRHVADNAAESQVKRTLQVIRAAGASGITRSALIRATHFLGRDRDQVLKSLVEAESITSEIKPTATKPTTVYKAK
jgi:hypothetical protein